MLAFMNGEFDVLVATTIIESGLDVPLIRFSLIMLIICLTCIRCESCGTKQQEGVLLFYLSAVFSND
jgi:late competence protein required for DNA uptake (superfamily II DNA/RNA helicase)